MYPPLNPILQAIRDYLDTKGEIYQFSNFQTNVLKVTHFNHDFHLIAIVPEIGQLKVYYHKVIMQMDFNREYDHYAGHTSFLVCDPGLFTKMEDYFKQSLYPAT